ncbi:MAG: hypothetical protein ABEK36_01655 [Candidatus Aenigmatarchaeota archaeon]
MVRRAFLFFILVSVLLSFSVGARNISIDHRGTCENFNITLNVSGFEKGIYDLKLEKLKPDNGLDIHDPSEGWKSSFFYLNDYIEIENNESEIVEVRARINSTEDLEFRCKLRNISEKWESGKYVIDQNCKVRNEEREVKPEPNISLVYEGYCKDYNITVLTNNFVRGTYDVKLNVRSGDDSRSSGMVYRPGKGWKSSFYYMEDVLEIDNTGENKTFKVKTNNEEDFVLVGKIRNGSKTWKSKEYSIKQYCSNEGLNRIYLVLILLISILVIQLGVIAYVK